MHRIAMTRRAGTALATLALLLPGCVRDLTQSPAADKPVSALERVNQDRHHTPTGQLLTPAGFQIDLPRVRPQALALSPDGTLMTVAGRTKALYLIDPADGRILEKLPLSLITTNANPKHAKASGASARATTAASGKTNQPPATSTVTNSADMSLTGLIFSPDGRRLYLSDAGGHVWAFPVDRHFKAGRPELLSVRQDKAAKDEIPTGLAVSADGKLLYVAGNLRNRLYELDTATGKLLRSWNTGVAPFDVVLVGTKVYVSNLGGRRPGKGDLTAPAGKDTTVRVDPVRHIASEGSVTVIDLASGKVKGEILTGLHASALAVSPGGKHVVVANTGSDTLSVIDTCTDQVVEKIWARQTPADLFGAQPEALTFDPSGKRLYVCNGTQNAVAVVQFDPEHNASRVLGLIPVGWFPGAVQFDAQRKRLCVANMKGVGAAKDFQPGDSIKLNSHDYFGTVSLIRVPSARQLAAMTKTALHNMHYPRIQEALLPARPGQPPKPVPERVGEPSVFKHVVYIIKENRTYDQILGDMPTGDGDPALCTFGEKYTPNQHKLAREFVLLDNTYCSGICSADGHQWTDSALANEYVERQLTSQTPRSYASGKTADGVDALCWASSGFLWDNALAHGKTFRNYGEWMISKAGWSDPKRKGKIMWRDFWQDYQTGACAVQLRSRAGLGGLRGHSSTNTVGWDLKVPDVMRAAAFIKELREFEKTGEFPNLIILFLPNDHTGGTRGENPTPGAQIADNDLAMGQVLEALSHSRFWPETCVFAIEDDPAAGWDHLSGYRTTCYVASPYTKRRQTISTQYNQISVVRTIELILGLPPMNQLDAIATPMNDCFTDQPDLMAFTSVTNRTPLDFMNPATKDITDRVQRQDAIVSARLPLDQVDACPEDVLNRILWRAMKGPDVPYPEWAVKAVTEDID